MKLTTWHMHFKQYFLKRCFIIFILDTFIHHWLLNSTIRHLKSCFQVYQIWFGWDSAIIGAESCLFIFAENTVPETHLCHTLENNHI